MIYIKKASKRFVGILLLLSFLLSFCSCSQKRREEKEDAYYASSKWNCTQQEFRDNYFNLYSEKIESLKKQYQIECEVKSNWVNANCVEIKAFNRTATLSINLSGEEKDGSLSKGKCKINLYFYGDEALLSDYSAQETYVHFLNDLVNYIAYDTKLNENRFETLYHESISQEQKLVFDYYRKRTMGNKVGYMVHRESVFGIYDKSPEIETGILCNQYQFQGALKPLY